MLPLPCMLVCSFVCANRTRDRGCSKHPVFPAPSNFEGGKRRCKPRAISVARSRLCVCRRMGGAKRYPSPHAPALMGIAALHPSYKNNDEAKLIPRDDLAFALMHIRGVEQIAAASAHQKFRTAGADRVVAAAAGGRFVIVVFRQ
jgi:hypothetical protein